MKYRKNTRVKETDFVVLVISRKDCSIALPEFIGQKSINITYSQLRTPLHVILCIPYR